MDILRNLFGSLTSGIIRLLVAVGILAAAYFFIVKPVLKTTDKAIERQPDLRKVLRRPGVDLTDIGETIEDVNRRVAAPDPPLLPRGREGGQPEAPGQVHPARRGRRPPDPALHRQVLSRVNHGGEFAFRQSFVSLCDPKDCRNGGRYSALRDFLVRFRGAAAWRGFDSPAGTILGYSRSAVKREVAAGRLHRLHRGVYAVGHRLVPPTGAAWRRCSPVGPRRC